MLRGKQGQSTLEYVLVLSAIMAALIFATAKFIRPKIQNSIGNVMQQMENATKKIRY